MNSTMLAGLLATVCLLLAEPTIAQTAVATRSGAVSGVTEAGVTSFKGIPYAAPPVGALRWKPPQPAIPWRGLRAADRPGPACMQPAVALGERGANPAVSEDCLFLNIWRSADTRAGSKRPVMVWIHGGGFFFGSGANPTYDGASLARRGVIVVTLNYRLGRFGWFAYPALTKEGGEAGTGNFGLMDDIAALRWVRDNIASFGGDPANVTIFGESAGGISVNALMVTRAARGLFAKAITQSGFGRVPARSLANAEHEGEAFAQSVGAADLAALRSLPAEAVLGPEGHNTYPPLQGPWPILDGKLITSDIVPTFTAGNEAPVPWIVGSNDFEASLFPGQLANPDATLGKLPAPMRDAMMMLYDPKNTGDKKTIVAGLLTDQLLTEPARFLAASHARAGRTVYRYLFGYVAEAARGAVPGAGHAAELPFVFGNLGTDKSSTPKDPVDDQRTAAVLGRYWTSFAKTGDPNGRGLAHWPRDGHDQLLVFDNVGQHAVNGLHKPQLDAIAEQAANP